MFNKRQAELDEIFERVLAVMKKSSNEASKRMNRIESLHIAAVERIARLEEANLATSKRIDRIEAILESNTTSLKELNIAAFNVFNVISLINQNFEVIQENFEIIVTEVKGIQTENRNVLGHLFGVHE
ncbi:hypothetical protein NIES4071_98240 [Calothrix sp. NIES-4071]|nr:hypothetical protein NIES4071_98240 [Calothrix sp. NIES-4071]BAZ64088.1 hypothetical protein NIES4105_98170 [Calothrix sp. NIES-4105]